LTIPPISGCEKGDDEGALLRGFTRFPRVSFAHPLVTGSMVLCGTLTVSELTRVSAAGLTDFVLVVDGECPAVFDVDLSCVSWIAYFVHIAS